MTLVAGKLQAVHSRGNAAKRGDDHQGLSGIGQGDLLTGGGQPLQSGMLLFRVVVKETYHVPANSRWIHAATTATV